MASRKVDQRRKKAVLAAYDKLPDAEKASVDRIVVNATDMYEMKYKRKGFGRLAALELVGATGMFIKKNLPNLRLNT